MGKGEALSKILTGKAPIGKYSTTNYRVVDTPTTEIVGEIKRYDERETGFNKAFRGDYGEKLSDFRTKEKSSLDMSILSYFFKQGMFPGMKGKKPNAKDATTDKTAPVPPMMMDRSKDPNAVPQPIHQDIAVVSRHIKSYGNFMGADLVGICEIPDYAYYSHDKEGNPVEKKYKYAICIVVDQDYDTLDASNGKDWISAAQSYMSYSKAAFTAEAMSKYINGLGFEAKDNNLMDYQVVVPPLLERAGIGEIGRYGIVINPSLGSRFKATVVLTNMPMQVDKPIEFGVQKFCKTCKKCAIECPSQSISKSDEKILYNGYKKYDFNHDTCTKFRLSNPNGSSCGNCIKVCPFNKDKGFIHDLARWTIRTLPIFNRLIVWGDDLMGYGKARTEKKWWFDFKSQEIKEQNNNEGVPSYTK